MDAVEENSISATKRSPESTSVASNNNSGTDEVCVLQVAKKTKVSWSAENVAILRKWLFENRSAPYPSRMQKVILSEQTSLSVQQISNWFVNARRRILGKMLKQREDNLAQVTVYHPKCKNVNVRHGREKERVTQVKSVRRNSKKRQPGTLSPLPKPQESGEKLLNPQLEEGQNLEVQSEEEVQIPAGGSLLISPPELVPTEEHPDFSGLQLLVDVAVQRAAQRELQKKQEPNP